LLQMPMRFPELREHPVRPDPVPAEVGVDWRALHHVCPQLPPRRAQRVAAGLELAFARFAIDTPERAAAAVALLAHESAGFSRCVEEGDGARHEGRRELGNVRAGDGWRFRGRGWIPVVGRARYRRVSQVLGRNFVLEPELLGRSPWAELAAALWWHEQGAAAWADRGDPVGLARLADPCVAGLPERLRLHGRALAVAHRLVPRAAGA
jgi:putative chitinase